MKGNLEYGSYESNGRRKKQTDKVILYNLAKSLYDELEGNGIIQRLKKVPQLGTINVRKALKKSRYDYIFLQLYFHTMIKDSSAMKQKLEYSYNNKIQINDELKTSVEIETQTKCTIGDVIQILTIAYNIGHYHNTFVSSRAIILTCEESDSFKNNILFASSTELYKRCAEKIIKEHNYRRVHLLNSILFLEHCNQSNEAVLIALMLLDAYINEELLDPKSKLKYAFDLFRKVRRVAYVSYDMSVTGVPFSVDWKKIKHFDQNKQYSEGLMLLFEEMLSKYNDNSSSIKMMELLNEMLGATVYYEPIALITDYTITKEIMRKLIEEASHFEKKDLYHLWLDSDSVLNIKYTKTHDFYEKDILKLTFKEKEENIALDLIHELNHKNNIRIAYYIRSNQEWTLLVALKKECKNKANVALQLLQLFTTYLQKIDDIKTDDDRFILIVKFFIQNMFSTDSVEIKPTVHENKCVFCTRGKGKRITELEKLLASSKAEASQISEVKFMIEVLEKDGVNDTTITVPASIRVTKQVKREFDGLIIHPYRKKIVFLETKDRKKRKTTGKKELTDKLDVLGIVYNDDDVIICDRNAYLEYSIKKR